MRVKAPVESLPEPSKSQKAPPLPTGLKIPAPLRCLSR